MLTLLECSQCTDGFIKGPLQKIPYILETIHKKIHIFVFNTGISNATFLIFELNIWYMFYVHYLYSDNIVNKQVLD